MPKGRDVNCAEQLVIKIIQYTTKRIMDRLPIELFHRRWGEERPKFIEVWLWLIASKQPNAHFAAFATMRERRIVTLLCATAREDHTQTGFLECLVELAGRHSLAANNGRR